MLLCWACVRERAIAIASNSNHNCSLDPGAFLGLQGAKFLAF